MIGSQLMGDLDAKPAGPESLDGGEPTVPLEGLKFEIDGFDLDSAGVDILGYPSRKWTIPRNSTEGLLPAGVLRKYRVILDYPGRNSRCRWNMASAPKER